MITVLFDSRASFLDRQSLMHLYFQKNPEIKVRPVSVFHDHISYNKYKYLENTELLSNYWEPGYRKYSKSILSGIEEKYGIINFWNIVASDRFIRNWKEDKIVEQISFYIFAWESIIEKYKPEYVVSETVTGLWNYLLFLICKHYNIKYLSIQTTKNTGRYYYSTDQFGSWKEFENLYKELLQKGFSQNEIKVATDFIEKFRRQQLVPPYMKSSNAPPNFIKYINFPRFIINLKKDLIQNWYYKNHDYKLGYRIYDYHYTLIRSGRISYTRLTKLFKKPLYDDKYILYPVHFQPEATTDIWAPYYSDQLQTIKSIARSLPLGYYLYVKEHSAILGSKSIKFYKEISKIPNVRLIDPKNNISELIKNSSAVIVLTSTTGLEAILWNKPTIVFGNVFYNIYPFIHRVRDVNDLPGLIKIAIEEKTDEHCPERLAFIYQYSLLGYSSDIYTHQLTDKEITCFAEELIEEISKQ
jgi:hypothetical protein